MVVHLSGPSYSSLGGTFGFPGWSMILDCVIPLVWAIFQWLGRWSWTWSTMILRAVTWWAVLCRGFVAGVVCHGRTCSCVLSVLNGVILSCFLGGCACPCCCDQEQPLCNSQWLKLWCLLYLGCNLDWSLLSQSSWWFLELDLLWQLLCGLWCSTSVPEGTILWGQSIMMCLNSSH